MSYYGSDDEIDVRVRRRPSLPIPVRTRSGDNQPLPEGLQHLHRRVPTFERERDAATTDEPPRRGILRQESFGRERISSPPRVRYVAEPSYIPYYQPPARSDYGYSYPETSHRRPSYPEPYFSRDRGGHDRRHHVYEERRRGDYSSDDEDVRYGGGNVAVRRYRDRSRFSPHRPPTSERGGHEEVNFIRSRTRSSSRRDDGPTVQEVENSDPDSPSVWDGPTVEEVEPSDSASPSAPGSPQEVRSRPNPRRPDRSRERFQRDRERRREREIYDPDEREALEKAKRELEELRMRRELEEIRLQENRRSAAPTPVIIRERVVVSDTSDESDINIHIRSSRSRSRYRSPSISSDEVSEYEDFIASKVYEFRPSRSSSVAAQSVSEDGRSDRESPSVGTKEIPTSKKEKPQASGPSTNAQIYESQYTGDAFIDGSHSCQLEVVQDPKKQRQPLFRWLHVKQTILNLDQLSDEVARDPEINDDDRKNIVKLLAEVRKSSKSKQTADGSHVKYMPPRTFQSQIPPDDNDKSQVTYKRWVTWLCIPYFSLEEYSGLLSSKNPAAYPNQTLWQAQYSGNAQERDMQQIVCQINRGSIPPKNCFHISQLWVIVLDTSLLITCGTMDDKTLQGDLIKTPNDKLPKAPSPVGYGRIFVSYSEAVLWSFPLHECTTWFEFVSHFLDFWPQTLQFLHQGQPVTEQNWQKKYYLARHVKVTLSLTIIDPPKPPQRGIFKPLPKTTDESKTNLEEPSRDELKPPSKGKETPQPRVEPAAQTLPKDANETFHVFTWLPHVQLLSGDRASLVDRDALHKQMEEVDNYLKTGTSFSDKKAYQDCRPALRAWSYEYLEEQSKVIEAAKNKAQKKQEYEERIDILNAADIVFRLFLPLSYDGPTVGKFWGAIRNLVEIPISYSDAGVGRRASSRLRRANNMRANAPGLRRYLRRLTQLIQSFEGLLSYAQADDRARIKVPDEFLKAWLHLLMGLVHSTQGMHLWRTHTDNAENLIKTGMRVVIDDLASHWSSSLLDRAAVLPMDLVSMACLTLFKDMTGKFRDISETFGDYLKALNSDITTKPSDRYTQHRIGLLKAEISVVQKTLAHQIALCGAFFPTAPKKIATGALPGLGPGATRTASHDRDRNLVVERERSYSKSRSHSRAPSYYDPGPGYQPAERTIVTTRVRESDPPTHKIRNRSYVDDDDDFFRGHHTVSRERCEDDNWTLNDSVLNPQEFYKLNPTYWGGFRDMLATECVRLLQRRSEEFEQYEDYAKELERDNANRVDVTKGRQEMAIYAFTITTIIFLPLSAVSSIFGMNTNDIRNMELDQWAYWATALPVTITVIVLGLWWMGELGNAFRWLFRRESSYSYALGRPAGRRIEVIPASTSTRLTPVHYVEKRRDAARPSHYRNANEYGERF